MPAEPPSHMRELAEWIAWCERELDAVRWRPGPADSDAAAAVRARLAAPLPARPDADARDRRLQRLLRTVLYHLDGGAVSPPAAALLAAMARAFLPWHAWPNPPVAAAAPTYATPVRAADGTAAVPTGVAEALLPGLIGLFTTLATPLPPGAVPRNPVVGPRRIVHAGRFRRHGRPAPGVWTAETFRCPGCGEADGPWIVTCDWWVAVLGCACGFETREHGLAFSEIWLPSVADGWR
ncbi:hypothetical protein [Streptomyces hydrogenans]|uniref:hypothetical protein n=1 Tax=Streptomyces hydrogenans TaxID=1873719 RepID=UPI0033B892DE